MFDMYQDYDLCGENEVAFLQQDYSIVSFEVVKYNESYQNLLWGTDNGKLLTINYHPEELYKYIDNPFAFDVKCPLEKNIKITELGIGQVEVKRMQNDHFDDNQIKVSFD